MISLCQPRLPSTVPLCALTLQRTSHRALGAGASSQSWGSAHALHRSLPRVMGALPLAISDRSSSLLSSFLPLPAPRHPGCGDSRAPVLPPAGKAEQRPGRPVSPHVFGRESGRIGPRGLTKATKTSLPAKSSQSSLRDATHICTGRGEACGVLAPSSTPSDLGQSSASLRDSVSSSEKSG